MTKLSVNTNTEKDLIQLTIKGDRSSAKTIYNKYAALMMTVCRRYARNSQEAEDFMHDGFIKVFKNLGQFQFNGSFEGWIRRIMVNTALKSIKKKSFTNEITGLEVYHDNGIAEVALSKLGEEDIIKMIATLPDGYRVVFNMYVIEGYSHKEIGEKLNVEESTSRSQLVKARRILQQKILANSKLAV